MEYAPLWITRAGGMYCNRKVRVGAAYGTCELPVGDCEYCRIRMCARPECVPQYEKHQSCLSMRHRTCAACGRVTCRPFGMCSPCDKRHAYDMITADVAIGSFEALSEPFDLLVDLDYPNNEAVRGEVTHTVMNKKHVIMCGVRDDLTPNHIETILTYVAGIRFTKALFLGFDGVSCSATVAIAYLARREGVSATAMLARARLKRPRIQLTPNHLAVLLETEQRQHATHVMDRHDVPDSLRRRRVVERSASSW